jgi:hypothetical protein
MADLLRETFVLTGKTGSLSRQDVRQRIQSNNGYVRDALPEPGDIVVVSKLNSNPPRTQKYAEAQRKGCRLISDTQLVDILNDRLALAAALSGQAGNAASTPTPATPRRRAAPERDVISLIAPNTGTYTVGF